jgi:prevent-host-death family protein
MMLVMSEILPLSSVKAHLSEIVDRVEDQHDRVVVTRNGKPAAVLISHDDLESLEETLAIVSDPALLAQVRESERAISDGEPGSTLADLRAGLETRRKAAA